MIDRQTIARILDAADIVDVVSEFVTLKKAGANYKGLCPFHSDKTPSFSVSPARNYCHCFSCGKGGTPVGFIMEHEQMTYPEALRWLARKYNIEVKEKELTTEEKTQESRRESMFIVNEWIAKYYQDILRNDADGRAIGMQYFRSRGFRDDIIEKFRLGFALDDRQALPREAKGKGYKEEFLMATGHCYNTAREGSQSVVLADRFAGRAIFPWISMSGKVLAFGGRKLDKATKGVQQKYVNSTDSDIFHKDHELYGIYQAKKAIGRDDRVFMVEGYTDVISMHQCGIENVVANSGTALSNHQIHMLRRLTRNIVLLYDGDAAGIHAALRGTDMLLTEGMNIKVLILPDGDDPDSFARKHTADEFREYVESHQTDFIQFKTEVLLKGVTDPIKRSEAISSIVKSVSVIPDPIIRATYLQDCAERLRMPEQTLVTQMNRFISDRIKEKEKQRGRDERQGGAGGSAPAAGTSASAAGTPVGSQPAQKPSSAPYDFPPDLPPDFMPDDAFTQPAAGVPTANTLAAIPQPQPSVVQPPVAPKPSEVEKLLLECVVKYGEEVIFENVETEDGDTVNVTVAEYVSLSMAADDLAFTLPIYTQIVDEAVRKSHEVGFYAAPYFSQNPDIEISKLACEMLMERYVLSKSFEREHTMESLRAHVEHLLLELRREVIDKRLKDILARITQCAAEPDKAATLMTEYLELRNTSSNIAKKLGRNIR